MIIAGECPRQRAFIRNATGASAAGKQVTPHPARPSHAINSRHSNPDRNKYHLYRGSLLTAQKIIHLPFPQPNNPETSSVIAGLTRDLSIIIEIPARTTS
jgi:hypothetical protein